MNLTIELRDEVAQALEAKAQESGLSAEEYVRQVVEQRLGERHISDIILENMSDVPDEVLAQLPEDGASEHDHYLYGLPKRNQ